MSREMPVGSSDRFGYEWAHYARILPEHERQLSRWMGSTGLASFAGKRVLDVGCGMGRNPFFMLKHGAKEVVAIDIDERSLEAARRLSLIHI
ncbi:MAG: class I SAM-dependent methyltransferase, partial [Deltaproteobacteria bacterium]|nr:class I SAM-dependent methyltransferase [Deltaproteobacteria bacterium]